MYKHYQRTENADKISNVRSFFYYVNDDVNNLYFHAIHFEKYQINSHDNIHKCKT
jgi:hypothetical protein